MVLSVLILDSSGFSFPMGWMLGNRSAMERIYTSFQKRIYDFLYKYTQNVDTAMDLLQDTFLSFFKSYGDKNLSDEQAIMLLYRIARNRSINHSKKFSSIKEIQAIPDSSLSDSRSFVKDMEAEDMEARLLKCLDDLEESEREVIILRFIEDLNLTQIGEIMEISVSTASRLVGKATSRLLRLAKEKEIHPN